MFRLILVLVVFQFLMFDKFLFQKTGLNPLIWSKTLPNPRRLFKNFTILSNAFALLESMNRINKTLLISSENSYISKNSSQNTTSTTESMTTIKTSSIQPITTPLTSPITTIENITNTESPSNMTATMPTTESTTMSKTTSSTTSTTMSITSPSTVSTTMSSTTSTTMFTTTPSTMSTVINLNKTSTENSTEISETTETTHSNSSVLPLISTEINTFSPLVTTNSSNFVLSTLNNLYPQDTRYTCPPPVNHCRGPKDCLYKNPDCTKFFACTDGRQAFVMDCPSGLEWNDIEKICDWPQNANCSSTSA